MTSRPERVACFRMNDICRRLRALSNTPSKDGDGYDAWLEQADLVEFLEKNAEGEKTVIYANVPGILMLSVLVPQADVDPPDVDDLLGWNDFPKSAHVVREHGSEMRIEPSLTDYSSESLSRGEPLVFNRSLEGVRERSCYVEILQKFSHVFDLHHMEGRNAWCRLDHSGDIEKIVETIDFSSNDFGRGKGKRGGRAVLFDWSCLEEYAAMTETILVRMFDCDRGSTRGNSKYETREIRSPETGIFYRYGVAKDPDASYTRGIQIVPVVISQEEVSERFRKRYDFDDEPHQEEFIVSLDLHECQKTDKVACDADKLLPAFFRPEVLSKYKYDPAKYSFEERSIGCRNGWHLEFYDINEAGQVYTFLRYLSFLPKEERTYWKSFNQEPKAPVSDHTINTGLLGKPDSEYSPLESIKNKLRCLPCPWWKMRSSDAFDRAHYPMPESEKDWKNEIKALDQLIVEGFERKWLREKAKSLGRSPQVNYGSLKLVEECLAGLEFEEDDARSIVAPFFELHDMRNKFSHDEGEEARNLTKEALKAHGDYRAHYRDLVARCDEALGILTEAFRDQS